MKKNTSNKNHPIRFALIFGAVFIWMTTIAPYAKADEESLFFASDIHNYSDILPGMIEGHEKSCETIALVGDYNLGDPDEVYSDSSDIDDLISKIPGTPNIVLARGNHDSYNTSEKISGTGPVDFPHNRPIDAESNSLYDNENYVMYAIDVADFKNFGAGGAQLAALEEFIKETPSDKVVVVLSHYPLHSTRESTLIEQSKAIFNTLQDLGEERDIVFLWGHNHRIPDFDANVKMAARPHEIIAEQKAQNGQGYDNLIAEVVEELLTFTYLNAGYLKPTPKTDDNGNPVETPSSTVVTISDTRIIIDRNGDQPTPQDKEVYRKGAPILFGDVNMDTEVNIVDALIIAQMYVGLPVLVFQADVADVNDDGAITIVDALIVAQYYVGLIGTLPQPSSTVPSGVEDVTTMEEAVELIQGMMTP